MYIFRLLLRLNVERLYRGTACGIILLCIAEKIRRVGSGINTEMTAEEFCRLLWQNYLVGRRYDMLGDVVDGDISVIGTGAHEISRSLKEFVSSMTKESEEWRGAFEIRDQWYRTTELSDTLSLVIGEICTREDCEDGILFDINFRFSVILKRYGESWRIIHLHQSVPDPNQAQDEFFPHRMMEKNGQEIIYNLRHDFMTGVLNRMYLIETVNRLMEATPEGLLLMIDVDDFKQFNDSYGHPFGDKVLILLAQSLKASFRRSIIGRIGGDEFVVYVPGKRTCAELQPMIREFKDEWRGNQRSLKLPYVISVSIGIARCPRDGTDYRTVWKMADKFLYVAKGLGKDQVASGETAEGE